MMTHLDVIGPGRRVADAYCVDGELITELPLGAHRDLRHQEFLTAILERAEPHYRPAADSPDVFVKELEVALDLRVVASANGPRRHDRQWR